MTLMSALPANVAAGLIAFWWFAVGTVIGSFLNVVVYRLPARMSIVRPGSHCPMCKTPIRWYDNIPVLGWLMLAGRCRHCRAAISPRYPLVEAFAGLVFLAIGWADCYVPSAGHGEWGPRVVAALRSPEVLALCLYHAALLSAVLAAALIELGGDRIPTSLGLFALAVAVCGLAVVPAMEAGLIAAAVAWYLILRPSAGARTLLGLAPSAVLGAALLAWVMGRPFWHNLSG